MSLRRFKAIFIIVIQCCGILYGKMPSIVIRSDTVLTSNFEVPEGTVCTIKPGVKIEFDGYFLFIVKGLLIAQGTREKPILFTGVDRSRGSMERPCWQGFEIVGKNSQASFKHCRCEGAYRNLIWESRPVFDSCEFTGNHYAIYCTKKSRACIINSRIYRNKYGIVADFASPMVLDNVITDNIVGVYLQLSSRLIAGRNVITDNKTDIRSEECFGDNQDALSPKYLWDLMRQLY